MSTSCAILCHYFEAFLSGDTVERIITTSPGEEFGEVLHQLKGREGHSPPLNASMRKYTTKRLWPGQQEVGNREAFPGAVGCRENKEKQGTTSVEFDGWFLNLPNQELDTPEYPGPVRPGDLETRGPAPPPFIFIPWGLWHGCDVQSWVAQRTISQLAHLPGESHEISHG